MAERSDEERPREPGHGEDQPGREPEQELGQEPEQEAEHPVDGRLRAYMGRLVEAQGRMKAADELGVNYKTLARGLDESGPLTHWLRAVVLLKALEDRVIELAPEGRGTGNPGAEVPAGRIEDLASDVRSAAEVLRSLTTSVEQLRREHGERLAALEARLAMVEAQPQPQLEEVAEVAEAEAVIGAPRIDIRAPSAPAGGRPAPARAVTEETSPGDEHAYGAAWSLVEEWRAVHARHAPEGTGVAWLRDEERLRELEIALIGAHELALPPEGYRWDAFTRRSQLRWRERTLQRVRGERRRAQWLRWLRRLLTLGLWWA